MRQRLASLGAGLVLLSLVTSGCFTQQSDGVFGPANSLGGVENNSPALSLKASPARGPGPLDVEFSLSALDRDGGPLTWGLDFGDRTELASGSDLPARPRHTYQAPGAYVATFKVIGSSEAETFVSTISIVVLEGVVPGNTTQGPEQPPEPTPTRSSSSGGGGGSSDSETDTSSSDTGTTSETGTSTDPPGNGTSSTSESSSSTSGDPTSSSSSSSDTGTSSSTGTETFSDPDPTSTSSSSSDTSTSSDPDPTGSESQSSTDPPL